MQSSFFHQCLSLQQVKLRYKELAMQHHPDRGGNEDIMKTLSFEYNQVVYSPNFNFSGQNEEQKNSFLKFPEIINKIVHLDVIIEIIGSWIWLSGNTRPHRELLRETGFYFAQNKKMWYYRSHSQSSTNRNPLTIDKIRALYGTDNVETQTTPQLERSSQ
jgi:hypothetical protein